MINHTKNKWQLRHFIREADALLQKIIGCRFTREAKRAFRRRFSRFIRELTITAIRLAENEGLDAVSEKHVSLAYLILMQNTNRSFYRHLGTIGGIILGASLSALLAMLSFDQFSITILLIPVALSLVGTFMVALYMAKNS